ncbi:protein mono-ADP-ribosyltransferase PARP14-like isoform X1 [Littorina saxatilis]|uniref:Poly [ADP-ribose] polymerase n=1 Tax=Littorina saxatilis TaxID=31220 RepID=A0AAN9BU53_9CAEN
MKRMPHEQEHQHENDPHRTDHRPPEVTFDTLLPESEGPPRTVEVIPTTQLLDELVYKLYFEKPDVGGPVETVIVDKENETVWVTFVSAEDAEAVCCRQHKIEDNGMTVKLLLPPKPTPDYPNKLLFRNVPNDVSKDHLTTFLENITGCEPEDILYGDDEGVVLATFDSEPDFDKVQDKCSKKKLKGKQLSAEKVAVSNCVLVENVARETKDETIQWFFENTKRSGGAPVHTVQRIPPGDRCLVYFHDYQALDSILTRKLVLDDQELETRTFLDCLGPSGGTDDPASFRMPDDFVVENEAKSIFLTEKSAYFHQLTQHLLQAHASVCIVSKNIVIECNLTPSVRNARLLARTWTDNVRRTVSDFLSRLHVERIQVAAQLTWPLLEKTIGGRLNELECPDILVLMEASKQSVTVVGSQNKVHTVAEKLRDIVMDVDAHTQRQKDEVEEAVSLKAYRAELLQAASFSDEMATEYPNLKVTISDGKAIFRGVSHEVKNAQVKMYAYLQNEESVRCPELSTGTIKVLKRNQHTQDYILGQFKAEGVTAVMEVEENEVVVFALTKADADRAARIVKDSVVTRVVQLSPESTTLLQTRDFGQILAGLRESHPGLDVTPADDRTQIVITTTDDVIDDVTLQVEGFISKNTIYVIELCLSPTRHKFVSSAWKQKLDLIFTSLRDEKVEVTADEDDTKFIASGARPGLTLLTERFKELEEKIMVQEETIESEERLKFLNSDKRDKDLRKLELVHRCTVGFEWETTGVRVFQNERSTLTLSSDKGDASVAQETEDSDTMEANSAPLQESATMETAKPELAQSAKPESVHSVQPKTAQTAEPASAHNSKPGQPSRTPPPRPPAPAPRRSASMSSTRGTNRPVQLAVSVVPGEIAKQKVDVIVNSTSKDLDLKSGAVSSSILQAAGSGLQDECRTQHPQGVRPGHIAATGGYKLSCQQLYHVSLPKWSGQQSKQILHQTVINCLTKCNQSGFKSIAIPALGTGNLSYPRNEVAQTMIEAVMQFQQISPFSGLRDVRLIVYHKDVQSLQAFQQAHRQQLTGVTQTSSPGPSRQMTVNVVSGEISRQQVDVIVNSTSTDLDLSNGAVSSSILQAAGSGLQDECRTQHPQGVRPGHIAVTGGHALSCRKLYHISLPHWAGQQSKQALHATVVECLTKCNQSGFTSIAIPALGTGNLSYPGNEVAQTMMEAIRQFQQTNPFSVLREVKIVVYHKDAQTMTEFQKVQWFIPRRPCLSPSAKQMKGKRHRRTFSEPGHSKKVPANVSATEDWECDLMGVRVTVKKGDISEEDVHAIVSLTNKKLDLSKDAVSRSLRSKCGMQLEEELKTKREDICNKGTTVTSGPNLKSSMILHVDGKKFSGNWSSGIRAVLEEAESYRAKSVAIPNLGTSTSKLASDLFKAVTKFCRTEDAHHIEEVRVVLTDSLHVPEFRRVFQNEMIKPRKEKRTSAIGKRMFQAVKNAVRWRHSSSAVQNKSKASAAYRPGTIQKGAKLYIYAESEGAVQEFLKAFDDHVKDTVTKMVYTDPALKSLNNDEMRQIRDIAEEADVRMEVWREVGRYELQGVVDVLPRVQKDVSEFLRAAEHQRRERENESLIAGMVQWSFLERTKTETKRMEYGPKENKIIETAYVQGQKTAEIVDTEGAVYVIDFDRMVEYPRDCPSEEESVEVIRKSRETESSGIQLPDTWTPHDSDEPVMLVNLKPSDVEYQRVKQDIMATIANSSINIVSVDRIQNVMLYQQYQAKKTHMDKQNGPGFPNERTLWHGTSPDAIHNINNHGFNRSYCGKNATAYGKGVYFATKSSYSTDCRYSPPDSSGRRFLYQCQVLVGHPTLGSSDMRFLPPRSDHVVCDSATNNLQSPDMYVIFNDTQAYPQYLITFT